MRTIGVRELKARLSQILREVQRGEVLLVTDRGRVVAELRQPGATTFSTTSTEEQALGRMASGGSLRLAERRVEHYPPSPIRSAAGTANDLLSQERGEE